MLDVNPQRLEPLETAIGEVVGGVTGRETRQPSKRRAAVVERHPQGVRDVIVASPRLAQTVRRAGDDAIACPASQHTQRFERGGHVRPLQTVVAVLPLREHLDEPLRLQPLQVHTGGRRRDVGHHGELGARAGPAVEQAVEHARARRLADRRGDGGHRSVSLVYIHTLMITESLMRGDWHTGLMRPHPLSPTLIQPPSPSSRRPSMTVTCVIRYQIDPFSVRRSLSTPGIGWYHSSVQRPPGGLFSAARGHERRGLGTDRVRQPRIVRGLSGPVESSSRGAENFAMAHTRRLILREERTFVEVVDGTFAVAPK